MKKTTYNLLIVSTFTLLSALFLLNSCKKDVTAKPAPKVFVCDTATISFAKDVQPIFINNCATSGCHNTATNQSGYTWETYAQISDSISIYYAINLIKHEPGFIQMPFQQDKLHDTLIAKIDCWLEAGRPNN